MRVLIDTSVWSLALRRGDGPKNPEAEELRRLIAAHCAVIIGPIRQEILSGVRDRAQFARLESDLAAFPDLPVLTEDYVTAATFFTLCRSQGIQGSNTDFLIGAVAVRHDLPIFTTDGDFRHFARCLQSFSTKSRRMPNQRLHVIVAPRRNARRNDGKEHFAFKGHVLH